MIPVQIRRIARQDGGRFADAEELSDGSISARWRPTSAPDPEAPFTTNARCRAPAERNSGLRVPGVLGTPAEVFDARTK